LTPVVLNQGQNTFFLVVAEDKRRIVRALRSESVGRQASTRRAESGRPTPWFGSSIEPQPVEMAGFVRNVYKVSHV
jgi:hypothetical protein